MHHAKRGLLNDCADVDKHGVESVHTKSAGDVAVSHGKSDDRARHVVCDSVKILRSRWCKVVQYVYFYLFIYEQCCNVEVGSHVMRDTARY